MSKATVKPIHELDPWKVRTFVHRERDKERHDDMTESIGEDGQILPGSVIDIRDRPREERMEDGRLCDYELNVGQGRVLSCRRKGVKFLAYIEEPKEVKGIKRIQLFTIENFNREPLPWAEKAKLIRPELQAGVPVNEIAKRLKIKPKHVLKMQRILDKTAPELADEVSRMPMNEAEVLTSLKPVEQRIVMDVAAEHGVREIKALVKRARQTAEEQPDKVLSKSALQKSLQRLDEDLKRQRDRLKIARRDHGIGPAALRTLLQDKAFLRAVTRKGINVSAFTK